ncbi:MAG: hypothetical protein IJN92_09525 [Lachnospiraceae bacterium]|nr:hypothetical protein [Lachnospiraceae bacterium]
MIVFTYPICNVADENIFQKQCMAIEKYLNPLEKGTLIEDVDGSKIQSYTFGKHKVTVKNSMYTNEVYVESDIDIKPYFAKNS